MASLIQLVNTLIWLYELLILARCVTSWIQADPANPIVRFIAQLTDPLLDATRKAFPFLVQGGLDLSPLVILFLIDFTRRYLLSLLFTQGTMIG